MSDFLAEMDRQQAQLDADDAAAKAKGQLVGRYITHPYADGQAYYKIVSTAKTTARIEVVRIGDGWVLPAWGPRASLKISEINGYLRQRDAISALFARNDDWWAKQSLGTVVHYRNGHGTYMRGTIVEHEGKKQMLPTALVGQWRQWDLPKRLTDGTLYQPHHVKKIVNREPFQPNESNMVEANRRGGENPQWLDPIDLTVPLESQVEREVAAAVAVQKAALAALTVKLVADPAENLKRLRAALDATRNVLANRV